MSDQQPGEAFRLVEWFAPDRPVNGTVCVRQEEQEEQGEQPPQAEE